MRTAVIGAGSWGTALALVLSDNGHEVKLWDRNGERLLDMKERHVNERYLPGVALPDGITYEPDAEKALAGAELAVFAVPAQHFARVFGDLSHHLGRDALVVNVAKGTSDVGHWLAMTGNERFCGPPGAAAFILIPDRNL